MIIGNKEELAFIIGKKLNAEQCEVDIWLSNKHVTHFDNCVYLPQFISSLENEVTDIKDEKLNSDYVLFNFGPTTDDVSLRAKIIDDNINLICEFNENEFVEITIQKIMMLNLYHQTIEALRSRVS